MDTTWLFLSGLFSLLGFAVFVYGRRQRLMVPALVGIGLMGYPYLVSGAVALVAIGMGLLVLLFFGTRFETGA